MTSRFGFRVLVLAIALLPAALPAGETPMERPSFHASQSVEVNAVVAAVNRETREVTLDLGEGESTTFVAGDEVRNFDQLNVGDVVYAEYVETLDIQVLPGDGSDPDSADLVSVARAEKGEKPGFAVIGATVVTATVESIDLDANTFELRGPDGVVTEYTARNPDNLRRAAVGDRVVFTVSSAVAVTVEAAAAE